MYPKKQRYFWISEIKDASFCLVLLTLFLLYVSIDLVAANAYYYFDVLKAESGILDYLYFSFVTSLTIGFGDLVPITSQGKIMVIAHGCTTNVYFAVMVAMLSAKLFYPRSSVAFSKKLWFDPMRQRFGVRLLNTLREKLINPEIRVFLTPHFVGNGIPETFPIAKFDGQAFLGKHDFTYGFPDCVQARPDDPVRISDNLREAQAHDANASERQKSRFRIAVSIEGNYGLQRVACVNVYYPRTLKLGLDSK